MGATMSRDKVEKAQKRQDVRSLSISPEIYGEAEDRVGELFPLVKNFSAYVQLLIQLDHKNKFVEQALASGNLPGRPDGAPRVTKLRGTQKN